MSPEQQAKLHAIQDLYVRLIDEKWEIHQSKKLAASRDYYLRDLAGYVGYEAFKLGAQSAKEST